MRILHITPSFCPAVGGLENYILNLCRQLIKNGHSSDVLTIRRKQKTGELLPIYDKYGDIQVTRIRCRGTERFRIFPPLFKYTAGYDLLHIHDVTNFCGYFAAGKWYHKKPMVVSTHGGFFHTNKYKTLKNIYYRAVLPTIFRRIDKVIAVSSHDYDIFRRICQNITVVPNGIDFSAFSLANKNIQKNTFLYFGRISKNKRLDNLIDTVCYLKDFIPDIRLNIIGQDWEGLQKHLTEHIKSKGVHNNISFLGQVTDDILLEELAKAHFFVSASQYEGFGLTVLEAMASGTIPIVNDIDPLNKFIRNRHNGFIVNFSQPRRAADEIINILRTTPQQQKDVAANAKTFARSFGWENIVQNIEAVYLDTLSCRSPIIEHSSPLLSALSEKP